MGKKLQDLGVWLIIGGVIILVLLFFSFLAYGTFSAFLNLFQGDYIQGISQIGILLLMWGGTIIAISTVMRGELKD